MSSSLLLTCSSRLVMECSALLECRCKFCPILFACEVPMNTAGLLLQTYIPWRPNKSEGLLPESASVWKRPRAKMTTLDEVCITAGLCTCKLPQLLRLQQTKQLDCSQMGRLAEFCTVAEFFYVTSLPPILTAGSHKPCYYARFLCSAMCCSPSSFPPVMKHLPSRLKVFLYDVQLKFVDRYTYYKLMQKVQCKFTDKSFKV